LSGSGFEEEKTSGKVFSWFLLDRERGGGSGRVASWAERGRKGGGKEREGELGRGWSAREKREKERGCGFKILNLILLYGCGSVINIITICYIFFV